MQKGARYAYWFFAWLFLLGVAVQVFLAGMVVVAMRMTWEGHVGLGHMLAGPLLFMVISMFIGRMPGSVKRLTLLLLVVYILQADVIIFLRGQAPVVSALHPVLALIDFALAWALARQAWRLARAVPERPLAQPGLESSS
jgi:hypothetical protein